jgi:hypothetical protein
VLAPQRVDQPLGRHDVEPVREQQHRQQGALLGRLDLDRPVRTGHPQRAEEQVLHRTET